MRKDEHSTSFCCVDAWHWSVQQLWIFLPLGVGGLLLRVCFCSDCNLERLLWSGSSWELTLGLRCLFCACGLAKAWMKGCTASGEVQLQSSVEFVNGVVTWSGVDWQSTAALILERCFIFKPICKRESVFSVVAVIVVSTQRPWLALNSQTENRTEIRDGPVASELWNWFCLNEKKQKNTNVERARQPMTVWGIGLDVCGEPWNEQLVEEFEREPRVWH